MLSLTAEREACPRRVVAPVSNMAEATEVVNRMESDGSWPEGFDAILTAPDGRRWMYTDRWDPINSLTKELPQ